MRGHLKRQMVFRLKKDKLVLNMYQVLPLLLSKGLALDPKVDSTIIVIRIQILLFCLIRKLLKIW